MPKKSEGPSFAENLAQQQKAKKELLAKIKEAKSSNQTQFGVLPMDPPKKHWLKAPAAPEWVKKTAYDGYYKFGQYEPYHYSQYSSQYSPYIQVPDVGLLLGHPEQTVMHYGLATPEGVKRIGVVTLTTLVMPEVTKWGATEELPLSMPVTKVLDFHRTNFFTDQGHVYICAPAHLTFSNNHLKDLGGVYCYEHGNVYGWEMHLLESEPAAAFAGGPDMYLSVPGKTSVGITASCGCALVPPLVGNQVVHDYTSNSFFTKAWDTYGFAPNQYQTPKPGPGGVPGGLTSLEGVKSQRRHFAGVLEGNPDIAAKIKAVAFVKDQIVPETNDDMCWRCTAKAPEGDLGLCQSCAEDLQQTA